MGVALAVVAVESIKALGHGGSAGVGGSQTPFSESAGGVSGFFEDFGNGQGFIGDGPLAGELATILGISVASDFGVSQMLSGHQDAAGRGTDGGPGVVVGEADSLLGQLINVGRFDFLLSVGTQFAISEVIGEDEDDVGLGLGC